VDNEHYRVSPGRPPSPRDVPWTVCLPFFWPNHWSIARVPWVNTFHVTALTGEGCFVRSFPVSSHVVGHIGTLIQFCHSPGRLTVSDAGWPRLYWVVGRACRRLTDSSSVETMLPVVAVGSVVSRTLR